MKQNGKNANLNDSLGDEKIFACLKTKVIT